MKDGHHYYQGFMSAMKQKISHKMKLSNTLSELLDIEKDAIYRRLRGEVSFSFSEMAVIAKNLGISLDGIIGIESEQSRPMQMNITRHINPTELDYRMFDDHVNLLKFVKDDPATRLMESGNLLPHYFYYDYEYFTRFAMLRWSQSSSYGDVRPYHEVTISERFRNLQKKCCEYARYFKSTTYVWDYMIFQRIVKNIQYFAKVRLIKEEDVALIKNDLIKMVNDVENLAIKGKHAETGNEVSIYISDINFDTNYSCLKSSTIQFTLFKTYIFNAAASLDDEVYRETTAWIRSLQRMSTLISISGEKFRAIYFDAQRAIIHGL
jgi:hypothetical protein